MSMIETEGKLMQNEELSYTLAKLGQWIIPIAIIAIWCFPAFSQQSGQEYSWVIFLQASIGTLVLVPCWIIARAQVKAHRHNK